jgi:hypothetical protein
MISRPCIAFAPALILAIGASACGYDDSTTVRVRDPSTVTLRRDWPGERSVVLDDSPTPRTATVTVGTLPTGNTSAARFRVDALRGDDGSTALKVETSLPLQNGDQHVLVPAHGILALPDPVSSALLQDDALRLLRCLSLEKAYDTEDYPVGYTVTLSSWCSGAGIVPMRLETPWSNVAEIRRTSTARRGVAIAGIVLGSFGVSLGAALLGVNKAFVQSPALTGLSVGVLLTSVGLGAWSVPSLVSPTKTTVLLVGH